MAVTYASKPCCDPLALAAACREQGVPADWLDRANTFAVPLGRGPGRGWVLLLREDLDAVSRAADHDLVFGDDRGNRTTLKKVVLLGATCVAPGLKGSGSQAYLCELADRRHHLNRIPIDKGYNVRSADGTTRLSGTLNAGVAWTWQQVVQDLATALGIGTLTLPFTPDATPENLCYYGHWAWPALCDVLDRVGCAVRYWPAEDTFSAVRLGVTDAASDAEADRLERAQERTWDADPTDPERAWRPEKVRVRFVRRPEPTDGTSPYWAVDVTLAAGTGVVTGSYVQVDDDLSALGATGTPSNSAALSTRASERAADWLRKRQGYDAPELVVYRDVQPRAGALLGSARGRVAFDDRIGTRTQVTNAPDGALERWGPFAAIPERWPPTPRPGWFARITAYTGGTPGTAPYSWQEITVSGTTWSDVSGSTGALNAVPIPTDGTTPPVGVGARVWMWRGLTADRYEFLPWQYAGVTGSTVPVPGLVSTTTQVMGDGRKEFASDLRVYESAVHSASDARAAITVSGTGGATNGATVTLFTDAGHTGVFGVNHNSGDPYTQVGASGGAGFQFRLSVASLYGHLTATGDISAGGSVLADADGVFYHGANVGQTYTALLKDRFGADLGLVFSGGILVGVT